jgi:hypothetical protein
VYRVLAFEREGCCCPAPLPQPLAASPEGRDPPVSRPPGEKSSPSSVTQRRATSLLNASFLAVPESWGGRGQQQQQQQGGT